jgi:4-carboxymuconolactone decarboxylase
MTADELREMAIFITHYVGFPLGSTFNSAVEKTIAKRRKAEERG